MKALATSTVIYSTSTGTWQLFATGAEDTMIRIMAYGRKDDDQADNVKTQVVLKKHTGGIQHLQWTEDGHYLFSGGGVDELMAWRVRRIAGFGIGAVCEASCPGDSGIPGVRITSFDISKLECTDKTGENGVQSTSGYLVSVVYADSTIRVSQGRFWEPSTDSIALPLPTTGKKL